MQIIRDICMIVGLVDNCLGRQRLVSGRSYTLKREWGSEEGAVETLIVRESTFRSGTTRARILMSSRFSVLWHHVADAFDQQCLLMNNTSFFSACLTVIGRVNSTAKPTNLMSDLYTSLQVSPRKKRGPPSDDGTTTTPKKLRTAYASPHDSRPNKCSNGSTGNPQRL